MIFVASHHQAQHQCQRHGECNAERNGDDGGKFLRGGAEPAATAASWRTRAALCAILLGYIALRMPVALQLPGGQDEEWYAVPGLMVARTGIPTVPYSRATDPQSLFWGAEKALYAMPPFSFYVQAPFFLVLPGGLELTRDPA